MEQEATERRDYGQLEYQVKQLEGKVEILEGRVENLQENVHTLNINVANMDKNVQNLNENVQVMRDLMEQFKGSYRTLIWIGGILAALGGAIGWFADHIKVT